MTKGLKAIMETIVLSRSSCWRPHPHMFGVRDGPSPLPGLYRLIFTPQASLETSITVWALFIALLLLLFAEPWSVYERCFVEQ